VSHRNEFRSRRTFTSTVPRIFHGVGTIPLRRATVPGIVLRSAHDIFSETRSHAFRLRDRLLRNPAPAVCLFPWTTPLPTVDAGEPLHRRSDRRPPRALQRRYPFRSLHATCWRFPGGPPARQHRDVSYIAHPRPPRRSQPVDRRLRTALDVCRRIAVSQHSAG